MSETDRKRVNVTVQKDGAHEHQGQPCKKGDVVAVPESFAKRMEALGTGKIGGNKPTTDPAPATKDTEAKS